MKIVSFFLISSALIFANNVAQAGAISPLKFCFEDTPQAPWTLPDGSGLNLELLKRVEQRLGEKFEIVAKPWKRCLEEVRTGVQDGLIGSALAPERQKFSVFPSRADGSIDPNAALNDDQAMVYIRTGSNANWNGKELYNVRQAIIVQRAYLVGKLLQDLGFQIKEIRSIHEALDALIKGGAELAILQGAEAASLVRYDSNIKDKVIIASTPFISLPMYLPINHKTYAKEPHRIQAIWNAIREIRASPDYRKLVDAARLP
ncbi:substrate-binding periplasmic protein [Undibacterium danionis]|uniref:Substrate-binding periplasmic protein n=1 Tax=Undibacterium danionis TaxID=1812100 RepID=A0ABV6IEQ9_9BURK